MTVDGRTAMASMSTTTSHPSVLIPGVDRVVPGVAYTSIESPD